MVGVPKLGLDHDKSGVDSDPHVIITTHSGDGFNFSAHIHELVRLGDQDFRSKENAAYIMRLGQCIALAAGPNAPHGLLVHLRDRMAPDLWAFVGDQWATASEFRYMDQDGRPTHRLPVAAA